jgi:hypothetical protein
MPIMAQRKTYKGNALPQDLSKMTRSQSAQVVDYLKELPLKELRKRQELVEKQLGMAKTSKAVSNLHIMDHHLWTAVYQKTERKR